jgi:hypothetical protein
VRAWEKDMTETDLRWRLRQLPRELEPERDLWPGIAARLQAPTVARRMPWRAGLAVAASLLVAVFAWRQAAVDRHPAPMDDGTTRLVQAEAQAITREYQAALDQYATMPVPHELVPGLATLDRSVADIRNALAADPGSVQLLQQLQRTYALRLSLTQRAATG